MQKVVVGALVTLTHEASELLDGEPLVLAAPDDVDGMWSQVDGSVTHVLLVGERRHVSQLRRHAALVADRGIAVAWLTLPHGPAAVVVLALQAASARLDAGLLPLFAERLAALTWSGAWTPSVARLEEPSPSIGQHLRSWMPAGAGFVVTMSGSADVAAVGGSAAPSEPVLPRGVLYCAGPALSEPARAHALSASGSTEVVELSGLRLDPEERFGSARAVELLALPADEHVSLPDVRTLDVCVVCSAVVPGEFCAYCHVRPVRPDVEPRGDQQ